MAPTLVCRKRPFTTHADRLRPRLAKLRLGAPASAASTFISATTQLRHLAVTNNRSVQALLAEATDLLFQARGLAARDE